jgi:hypothetical protein
MLRNQGRKIALFLAANLAALAFFCTPNANAQSALLSPTGGKGQLVFDNITGIRANVTSGVSYSGDVGFSIQRFGVNTDLGGGVTGTNVFHATTVWLAPQADYFVINHLSVGGLLEIASTSTSEDIATSATTSTSKDTGSNFDFTLLPRVGWMFAIGDRVGIWPRGAIGYASRHDNSFGGTFSGVILQATCPFLYRINETFFVELSPDVTWVPGSYSIQTGGNASTSTSASYVDFGATGGLGIMLDL